MFWLDHCMQKAAYIAFGVQPISRHWFFPRKIKGRKLRKGVENFHTEAS